MLGYPLNQRWFWVLFIGLTLACIIPLLVFWIMMVLAPPYNILFLVGVISVLALISGHRKAVVRRKNGSSRA